MKGIKKTLMAGLLACATFNAQAEVSPWGYGVKAYGGVSSPVRYTEAAKIGGKKVESSFLDTIAYGANLYGEYAFTDYIGFGLEAGYKHLGFSLTGGEEEKKEADTSSSNSNSNSNSNSISSHGIALPFYLCFYPFGRDIEDGILKFMLGGSAYIPLATTCKSNSTVLSLTSDQEKEKPGLDIAAALGVAYEFPFGFSVEGKYSHGFMNRFRTQNDKDQTIFNNIVGLKKSYLHNATLGLGYNFASLLSE